MSPQCQFAGNVKVATRAALRAQHYVMLAEKVGREKARLRLGIAVRTARRYWALWGTQ